ncbi:conserved hypothetical protein [Candidatus Magnetomoraceae bacterium gMMP-15]
MKTNNMAIFNMPELLVNFYNEMAISPISLLKNYALNMIYSKIHKYEAENSYFTKKYNCTFHELKHRVDRMENEEIFEWEDDLMDWEFAAENLNLWRKKKQEFEAE